MDQQKGNFSTPEDHSNSSKSNWSAAGKFLHPTTKPAMDWEQPDFEELDLCMEVTTYVYHWQ